LALETQIWFPNVHIAWWNLALSVGGMDKYTTSCSINSPSLTTIEIELLIHIGNGGTSLRWSENTTIIHDWTKVNKNSFFFWFRICTFLAYFLPQFTLQN
jgi:hypothetical protein